MKLFYKVNSVCRVEHKPSREFLNVSEPIPDYQSKAHAKTKQLSPLFLLFDFSLIFTYKHIHSQVTTPLVLHSQVWRVVWSYWRFQFNDWIVQYDDSGEVYSLMMGRAKNVRPTIVQTRVTPKKVQVEGEKAKPLRLYVDRSLAIES